MYSRFSLRALALLLALVMGLSLLAGCGSGASSAASQSEPVVAEPAAPTPVPEPEPTPKPEMEPLRRELFTPTVHDFEGYRVENLDEQEDTNFLVYNQDVTEISSTPEENTVTQADFETQIFRFKNPSPELAACQPGQVVFVPSTGAGDPGFAFKVEEITWEGDTLVIYGSQPSLEEVLAYAEIEMDIPLQQAGGSEGSGSGDPSGGSSVGGDFGGDTGKKDSGMEGSGSGESDGREDLPQEEQNQVEISDIPIGLFMECPLSIDLGAGELAGKADLTLETIHVEYFFFPQESYLYSAAWVDASYGAALEFGAEGESGTDLRDPLRVSFSPKPIPVGAALGLQFDPAIEIDFSAKLVGEYSWHSASRSGFQYCYSDSQESDSQQKLFWNRRGTPTTNLELKDFEGTCSFALDLKFFWGFKNAGEIHFSPVLGLDITGKLDQTAGRTEEGPDIDFVHDCQLCVDGESEYFADLRLGGKFCLKPAKDGKKGIYPRIEAVPLHLTAPKVDFYIAKRQDGIECELTECPHKRYRCTVEVGTADQTKLAGANVVAKYEDGRTEEKITGKDGTALVYLPYGAHTVTASRGGGKDAKVVTMGKEPISVRFLIEDNRTLYVVTDFTRQDENGYISPCGIEVFPELEALLKENFSKVVFFKNESEFDRLLTSQSKEKPQPGDVVMTFKALFNMQCGHRYNNTSYSGRIDCTNTDLHIYLIGAGSTRLFAYRSQWYVNFPYSSLPSSVIRLQILDHPTCGKFFNEKYDAVLPQPVPGHDHIAEGDYYKAALDVGSPAAFYSPAVNAHFLQASLDHIESLFPAIYALMNGEWPY